jgi:putative FmdB family regulatory protein
MPVYTYRCESCGHQFDKRQSFSDGPLKACPNCRKHTLQKVYHPAGVAFKGSGFYVTDRHKSSATSGSKPPTKGKENGAKEAKPEKKGEAPAETSKPAAKESKSSPPRSE